MSTRTPGAARDTTGGDTTAAATVALAALSVVTAAGMGRLFRGPEWAGPVLMGTAVTHLACWWLRRSRVPNLTATPAALLAGALVVVWWVLPGTTVFGLPLAHTWSTVAHDLNAARSAYASSQAPVRPLPGFVLAAGAGGVLMAALADWAAFRLDAALEALIPALATLIFVSVMANDSHPTDWVAGFVLAAGLFLAAREAARRQSHAARFSGGSGRRSLVGQAGIVLAAVATAGGVVIGPHIPGARAAALVPLRPHSATGPSRRTTISPLVDIRSRLVQQSDTELFTVRSATPAYWRLTSLDHFDGNIWSSNEPYSPVGGQLPVVPAPGSGRPFEQSYTIGNLGSIWLPAAYLPVSVSGAPGVSWDERSQSLISRAATSNGESYRITTAPPQLTPAELRTATDSPSVLSPVDRARYTALPAIPADVAALAQRITAGAPTLYDRALALQNFLRDHYAYSLNVPPGHSNSALESFLFVTRRGYCEQFAGSYAVMARAVGLPTRVAVGFTPGVAEADGRWHVTGGDAHAWPEVDLAPFGWVAFDPTPGRGMPGAQAYTGVPAEQQPVPPAGASAAPATTAAPAPSPARPRPTTPPPAAPGTRHPAAPGSSAWLVVPAGIVAAVLLWVLALAAVRGLARRRRRGAAVTPADQVLLAWAEAGAELRRLGLGRHPGETLREHAGRLVRAGVLGAEDAAVVSGLARQAEAAAYGPGDPSPEEVATARTRARQVQAAVDRTVGRWRRLTRGLDPRWAVSRA